MDSKQWSCLDFPSRRERRFFAHRDTMPLAVKRFTTSGQRAPENCWASHVCENARPRDETHMHRGGRRHSSRSGASNRLCLC